jgi:cytochrome P450
MRKISAPAFSEKNFQMVWDETLKVMDEYFEEWEGKDVVVLDHFLEMTLALALQVIGSAGKFFFPFPLCLTLFRCLFWMILR